MAAGAAVSLRGVSKWFGEARAVDDLSLEIPAGAFVTLLGPSGCGKSTTLRMIGGFELSDRGEIAIDGVAMGNRPPYQRPTSMVFQQYALFPHLTVQENVAFGLRERGLAKAEREERVARTLALVELAGFAGRRPAELSGGQQQRVALARSLVLEPTVLLLDEPLGALDLRLRRQMQLELKQIQRQVGITFISVTHDQDEALTMSDRIVVMNAGRIEQEGTPEAIFATPQTRFVAEFTGSRNILPGEVQRVDGDRAIVRVGGLEVPIAGTSLRAGEAVDLVVRPECVLIGAGEIAWETVVTEQLYKGSVREYRVTMPDGASLVVEVASGEVPLAIGARVTVGFDPASLVVLCGA